MFSSKGEEEMNKVIKEYNSIVNLLEGAHLDLVKGTSGNKSAAIRARHQLRAARDKTNNLVKLSLEDSANQQPGANRHHFGNAVMSCFYTEAN